MNNYCSHLDANRCVVFWKAILNQAINDALKGNGIDRKSAIRWFFGEKDGDFYFVCNCAQVSPHKVRSFLINEFAAQDPDIIKNSLYEAPRIGRYPAITLAYKSIPRIDPGCRLSFIYEGSEMYACIVDDKLWFSLSLLNHRWKFCNTGDVAIRDISTLLDLSHLRRSNTDKVVLFADITGIFQLSVSLRNNTLDSFANWIAQENYKRNIIKLQDYFETEFQDYPIFACVHKNKLFLRFSDISKVFFLTSVSCKKAAQGTEQYFYTYVESSRRQLMVRSDLLVELIEQKKPGLKRFVKIKPKVIQWIKEQQRLREGENK